MTGYRYIRGGEHSREIVEFDIMSGDEYITTCVVDVEFLLYGIRKFPCGSGDDVRLSARQQLEILELVQEERKKLTSGVEVKTMEGWRRSGLTFDDYFFPGDVVEEDIVDHFVNVVPPVTLQRGCVQVGEEHSEERDENGKYRPTYATFHRVVDGLCRFDGYCFKGENKNRVEKTYRQERFDALIMQARKEAGVA